MGDVSFAISALLVTGDVIFYHRTSTGRKKHFTGLCFFANRESRRRGTAPMAGAKVRLSGAKLIFTGAKIVFTPAKVIFTGAKVVFAGAKVVFAGVNIVFAGAKFMFPRVNRAVSGKSHGPQAV